MKISFQVEKEIHTSTGTTKGYKIKPLRSGLLLIEVDQKEVHDKLLNITSIDQTPVTVEPHATLNISKGTIRCDGLSEYSNKQLVEELRSQNVTDVYRILKPDGQGGRKPTNIYIITFRGLNIPDEIKIGYMNCKVKIYIPKPRRCHKCQGFGHVEERCNHDPVCAKCAKLNPDHEYKQYM